MDLSAWIDIIVILCMAYSLVIFLQLAINRRVLLYVYFSLSILFILFPYVGQFIWEPHLDLMEWGRLAAITTCISGLIALIRVSKPVFARFPAYLTALPLVSFLFYPFIVESIAIKDLINAIFQGGALIVSLLVFSINHHIEGKRGVFLFGIIMLALAYLIFWFVPGNFMLQTAFLSESMVAIGVITLTFGFQSLLKEND